jgi:hypothetical protein
VAGVTRRPPTSGDDRALSGHRARTPAAGVPVDPLATTTEDIDASFDALTPPPQMVEEIRAQLSSRGLDVEQLELGDTIATLVGERLGRSMMHAHKIAMDRLLQVAKASPGSELAAKRLAELETWRAEMRDWRLRLTGVDERDGRLGRLDHAIAEHVATLERAIEGLRCDLEEADAKLRADVGTSEEAAEVRGLARTVKSIKARTWAAIVGAVLAAGGGGYGVLTRDQARDASVRADARQELRLEVLEQGLQRLGERIDQLFSRRVRDPDQPTRTP